MKPWVRIALGLVLFLGSGCQSDSKQTTMILPDRDDESTADGAAYAADSMHFRIPMPSHPNWQPSPFYFKHCSEMDERSYYSKTSYDCSYP